MTSDAAPKSATADKGKDAYALLQQEVAALLNAKKAIDESEAKRLRKEWNELCGDEQNGGESKKSDNSDKSASADTIEKLTALFDQLHERIQAQVEQREKQFTQLEAELKQLHDNLESGNIKKAQQLEQSTIKKLNQIPGLSSQRRQKILVELDALKPKLREMAEWRKWGTTQSREKIIEEIKELHKSKKSIPKIAKHIQQARDEWKKWDASGEGSDRKLYEVFNRECTKAYKPCLAYFAEQRQKRENNNEIRKKICEGIEKEFQEVDWHNADWKKIQQRLREYAKKWQSAGQTEYRYRKSLQQRYATAINQFYDRVDRERERNYKGRENLVAEAIALEQRENTRDATEEFKKLSKKWATTVVSSRPKEQDLWKRFTEAGDAVFQKHKNERKNFEDTLKQNLTAKQTLCSEIENSAKGKGDSTGDEEMGKTLRGNLAQWKKQWEQLGGTPKFATEKINTRYRNALKQIQSAIDDADSNEKLQLHNSLRQKSQLCADMEALALAGSVPKSSSAKSEKLSKSWESLPTLPNELEKAINKRYRLACDALNEALGETKAAAGALKRLQNSLPKNLEALHEQILHLEILVNIDSPPEFSKQRMAVQVNRLSAAMGKGDSAEPKSTEQLIQDILLVGAVEKAEHTSAFKRLEKCDEVIDASSATNQKSATQKPSEANEPSKPNAKKTSTKKPSAKKSADPKSAAPKPSAKKPSTKKSSKKKTTTKKKIAKKKTTKKRVAKK